MVRSLSTPLTNAVNAVTRVPALVVTIEDHIAHFELYQAFTDIQTFHDACVANDGSIVRMSLTNNGPSPFAVIPQFQRITNPATTTQWSAWTTFPSAPGDYKKACLCSISNNNGTLRAFAQRTTSNQLQYWTSTNNGQTWTTATTLYASINTLAMASTGNNDLFVVFQDANGTRIGVTFYNGTSWSTLYHGQFTDESFAQASLTAVYRSASNSYVILFSCGSYIRLFSYAGGTFHDIYPDLFRSSNDVYHNYPKLSYDAANQLYTLVINNYDLGTYTSAGKQYPRICQSKDGIHWSHGTILPEAAIVYGSKLIYGAFQYTYLITQTSVYRATPYAQANAKMFLDVSNTVIAYTHQERASHPATLEMLLDNTAGVYATMISQASNTQPIGPNCLLKLQAGYKTGAPPTTASTLLTGTFYLKQIEVQRSADTHQIKLLAQDISYKLDAINRFQTIYHSQTLGYLLQDIAARAGLLLTQLPSVSQMTQVIPTFVLQAGRPYRIALKELCNLYALHYFVDHNEVLCIREVAPTDTPVWSYQPEIEAVSFTTHDQRHNYVIVIGQPPDSGSVGSLLCAERFDEEHLRWIGEERVLHHVDQKLTSVAQCESKADFLLAQEQRRERSRRLTVPFNPALQLLDVVTITDAAPPVGSGQSGNARILHNTITFDAQSALYSMTLELEGV